MDTYDVIVIGAGAGGLMTAAHLTKQNVLIIERNASAGAKIAVSGGGKCNITNEKLDASFYDGDERFIGDVLRRFDNNELLAWLKRRGLSLSRRPSGQYFCAEKASDAVDLLLHQTRRHSVMYNTYVTHVDETACGFVVETTRGTFCGKRLVVASGGLSYPRLGASGIGYEIAERFGHTIVPTAPALVGLTVQKEQFFFKELSGVSLPADVDVAGRRFSGNVLFAHKGISGPAMLNASLYWKKGKISVNFLPGFSIRRNTATPKRLSSVLPLPKRAAKAFLAHFHIADMPANRADEKVLRALERLHRYDFAPAGTFGYSKAEVTKGGVSTDEIDASTMMSRKKSGLYFVGEVVDVTGQVGGYNFQWAFSSAWVAAQAIKKGRNRCK